MSDFPIDVHYACLQLGLADGGCVAEVPDALLRAEAYRLVGKERLRIVRRFAAYFTARAQLGLTVESFSKLRKSYYRKAMALHPDRGGQADEEALKSVNAAYELVEAVYREAQQYFREDEATRAVREQAARHARRCELAGEPVADDDDGGVAAGARAAQSRASPRASAAGQAARQSPMPGAVRFCAASVPRSIRNARLPHLGRDAVIGSWMFQTRSGQNLVYDIIMLPEPEFMRAKLILSLAAGQSSSLELTMSKLTPAYRPMDTKQLLVPAGQARPWHFARTHFRQAFGLEHGH